MSDSIGIRGFAANPATFRAALLIDADHGPTLYGPALDPWQREDFAALDPALRCVVGQDVQAVQRFYLERPRGHSKTTDIAASASWLLFASRRKLTGVACAADREQAGLILAAIDTLRRLNAWLAQILEVQHNRVINRHTGSTLSVISSDAATSYGLLLDFAIVDELTVWKSRDLWDSIFSAAAKRRHCLLLVISNAGFSDSWQFQLREAIRHDPAWYFRRLDGPLASWISQDRLAEQRRLLPSKVYARVWLNAWADGAGDALESADIDASISLAGPLTASERGWLYVAGLDVGLKRDASALVILGKHVGYVDRIVREPKRMGSHFAALSDLGYFDAPKQKIEYQHTPPTGKIRLASVTIWNPKAGRVELEDIEREILAQHERFRLSRVVFDPWQAEYLSQRLQKRNILVEPTNFTPSNLQAMATATLDAFRERQVELYDHRELIADVRALRVVEKSYGYRLEAGQSSEGTHHGDAATALSLALLGCRATNVQMLLDKNRDLVLFSG